MRKWIAAAGLAYVLYGLFFYWYFFLSGDSAIPEAVKGTQADPASFMKPSDLEVAEQYSNIKNFYFLSRYLLIGFCFLFCWSAAFQRKSRNGWKRPCLFVFCRSLVLYLYFR